MICPDVSSLRKSPVYSKCIYAECLNRSLIDQELKLPHCQTSQCDSLLLKQLVARKIHTISSRKLVWGSRPTAQTQNKLPWLYNRLGPVGFTPGHFNRLASPSNLRIQTNEIRICFKRQRWHCFLGQVYFLSDFIPQNCS